MKSRIPSLMALKQLDSNQVINQQIVSEATGIPQSTLSKFINGDIKRIEVDSMVKLCEYFNCSLDDLFLVIGSDGNPLRLKRRLPFPGGEE